MHYENFQLRVTDIPGIQAATIAGKLNWNDKALKPLKQRIRRLHFKLQKDQCCYCRKSLTGEFNMVIDVEHVLPQSVFPDLTFDPVNLSVACKRCNLLIKKDDWSFVGGLNALHVTVKRHRTDTYEIIHPNLDIYERHIEVLEARAAGVQVKKYRTLDAKGERTYHFFELKLIEIARLDRAQGLAPQSESVIASKVRGIFSQ